MSIRITSQELAAAKQVANLPILTPLAKIIKNFLGSHVTHEVAGTLVGALSIFNGPGVPHSMQKYGAIIGPLYALLVKYNESTNNSPKGQPPV